MHELSRDLIVWGLQYIKDANGDTFRLAVAQGPVNPANGSFFYYDFTAQLFGFPTGDWLDFPALAYGTNKLYLSSNVFTAGGSYAGTVVAKPADPPRRGCHRLLPVAGGPVLLGNQSWRVAGTASLASA